MNKRTSLWSWRYSHAKGDHWVHERFCDRDTADLWYAEFRKDEPKVCFSISPKKPRTKPIGIK